LEELITVDIQCVLASILGAITVFAVLHLISSCIGLKKVRPFYVWIGALAVLGGAWAFLFPLAINADFSKDGDGAALRQALIYTAGGLLGVITLGETRHKNDQEHMRQVHAERRSRYATAIEQLADEKAPIRLGGVYTLVKLVDEWLADETTLLHEEDRREEGQAIINSLCAYIRSPFDLASSAKVLSQDETPENYKGGSQQLVKDRARFREEEKLRREILGAIRTRLNNCQEDDTKKLLKGSWSDFDYDFSNAIFFYDVNFENSYFDASSKFTEAIFIKGAKFTSCTFSGRCDFCKAHILDEFHITSSKVTGEGELLFINCEFSGVTQFSDIELSGTDDLPLTFMDAKFFKDSIFEKFTAPKKDLIKLVGAAFPKTYFSNNHTHKFKDFKGINLQKELLAERSLKGKNHEIPKESILFDPSTGETDLKSPGLSPILSPIIM
jgi:putative uncharacterized protein (fragment)